MANGMLIRLRSGQIDVEALRTFVESLPGVTRTACVVEGHSLAYELRAGASPADPRVPHFEFGPQGAAVRVDWSDNAYGHAARAMDWVLSRYACEGWDFDYNARHEDNQRCRGWLRDWQIDELGHTPEMARRVFADVVGQAALVSITYRFFEWELLFRPVSDVDSEPEFTLQFGVDAVDLHACGQSRFDNDSSGLEHSERVAALLSRLVNNVFGVREVNCTEAGDLRLVFDDDTAPILALRSPSDAVDGSDLWSLTSTRVDSPPNILAEGHVRSGIRVLRRREENAP